MWCKAVASLPRRADCSHSTIEPVDAIACNTALMKQVFPRFCRPAHRAALESNPPRSGRGERDLFTSPFQKPVWTPQHVNASSYESPNDTQGKGHVHFRCTPFQAHHEWTDQGTETEVEGEHGPTRIDAVVLEVREIVDGREMERTAKTTETEEGRARTPPEITTDVTWRS